MKFLVVDDHDDLRRLISTLLELNGVEVVGEASDGLEALQRIQEHQPDAVIMDLAMPNMDGLTALPRLKELAPTTPIVILSGFHTAPLEREVIEAGACAFLVKDQHMVRHLSELIGSLIVRHVEHQGG